MDFTDYPSALLPARILGNTERAASGASVYDVRGSVFTAVGSVYFTRTGKPKTLFRTAVSFLLRHIFILRIFFSILFFKPRVRRAA